LGGVLAGYGAALRKSTIEEKLKLDTLKQYYIRDLYSRLLKPVDLPNETNYSGSIFFNAPSQLPVTVIIEYKNASYGFAFDSPTPTSPSSLLTPTSPPLTLSLPPPTLSVSPSISPPSAPAEE
jgi:hypothetical protein